MFSVSEARTIARLSPSPIRFVSTIRFSQSAKWAIAKRKQRFSILYLSSFFSPKFSFCNSYLRRSLSGTFIELSRHRRQCRLKSQQYGRSIDGEGNLNFVFAARAIKISSDAGGIEIGHELSPFKIRSGKWKTTAVFKRFFRFPARSFIETWDTQNWPLKETTMHRFFQGKWNILFKINATVLSRFKFLVRSEAKNFPNDLWRACNRCTRRVCTPYCFQFLIRIRGMRY